MLLKTWQWVLGMIYVVAVAVIWIVASFVVQSVVDSGVSPFLIAYICNTLFLVYIPVVELGNVAKSLLVRMRSKHIDVDTLPGDLSKTEKSSETDNLLEAGHRSADQGSQALAVSKSKAFYPVPDVAASENTCSASETSVIVEGDSMLKPSSSPEVWTRKKIALASLIVCPFWFLAQYTFNLSLKYTTVTSNTILSSTSSLFTFFMSLKFLKEKFAWVKLWSVLLCMAGTIVVSLSDSEGSTSVAKNHVWGDVLCLVSAGFYAVYTTLIKKKLPDEAQGEEKASTALFFGYLGLFNGLLLLPVVLLLHFTGVERLQRLSALQYGLIIGKGLSHAFLSHFWSAIWDLSISRRVTVFLWMLAHAGLTVGTWAAVTGHDPTCCRCHLRIPESQHHCLWSCPLASSVWSPVCALLSRAGLSAGYVSWGAVAWLLQFPGPHISFEGDGHDQVFRLSATGFTRGTLDMLPPIPLDGQVQVREPIFSTVAAITLWCIWKARCLHVLSNEFSTTQDTLALIWTELIHSLRSQWDASCGSSRAAEERRFSFIRTWGGSSMFFQLTGGVIRWHYSPPRWFILHGSLRPP